MRVVIFDHTHPVCIRCSYLWRVLCVCIAAIYGEYCLHALQLFMESTAYMRCSLLWRVLRTCFAVFYGDYCVRALQLFMESACVGAIYRENCVHALQRFMESTADMCCRYLWSDLWLPTDKSLCRANVGQGGCLS